MPDNDARIMLIRHAEKPQDGERGVDAHGHPDDGALSVTGWMRAGALVRWFSTPDAKSPHIVRPAHLVAAGSSEAEPSTRPRDTLKPLAQALGLALEERPSDGAQAVTELAAHLRSLEGPVLVCWRHDTLPALANELMQRAEAPERWAAHVFDVVWVVEQQAFSRTLAQVPQRLLPGDSAHTLRRRRAA